MNKVKYNMQVQTGRSMVEMLSVLAIIGVLSIAGIGGYRAAINKHKANKIIYDASLALAELRTMEEAPENTEVEINFTPDSGLTTTMLRNSNGYDFAIIKAVPKAACEKLKDSVGSSGLQIYKNDATNTAFADCADTNDMRFSFDNLTSGTGGGNTPEPEDPCSAAAGYTAPTCNENECCELTGANDSCGNPTKANKTGTCGTNGYCSAQSCIECSENEQVNASYTGCEAVPQGCQTGYKDDGNGNCIACVAADATDNESVCTACGWEWGLFGATASYPTQAVSTGSWNYSYGCTGDDYCSAKYGEGTTWHRTSCGQYSTWGCLSDALCLQKMPNAKPKQSSTCSSSPLYGTGSITSIPGESWTCSGDYGSVIPLAR